jgi:hypothetical protein
VSIKSKFSVLGLQPLEIDGLVNFPIGGKHTIFRKSKYNLEFCGIVVYLLNKLLVISLHSEVVLCVGSLILVDLSQDGIRMLLRDFQ